MVNHARNTNFCVINNQQLPTTGSVIIGLNSIRLMQRLISVLISTHTLRTCGDETNQYC